VKKMHELNTATGITYCGIIPTEQTIVAENDDQWQQAEEEDRHCKKCELLSEPSYRE